MGCCVSSNKSTPPPLSTESSRAPPPPSPPPHPLEETVKEVLSETPKSKSTVPKILEEPKKTTPLLANIQEEEEEEEKHDSRFKKKLKMVNCEEIFEISEIYSTMSESISTTTERRDDDEDGEVRQRVVRSPEKFKHRSLSGDFSARKDRGVAKSPARRSEPSPDRARIVSGRERRGILPDWRERDTGESSRRRSRSPATRNDDGGARQSLGRSPSVGKTWKSPGRVRSDLAEMTRKVGGSNREGKWPSTSNELLENPLVSLECFIFL